MGKKSKGKREDRLVRGDELLENAGIDLDADDETLLPRLIDAIGSDPDSDLSIADLLGSIPSQEAARRLTAWEAENPADKDLRRVLRASLFRLEQRGIAEAKRARPVSEPLRLDEPREPIGYLSPLDGAGNRLAWLTRPRTAGGLLVVASIIQDRAGMRQIDAYHANRTQFREACADAAERGAPLAEAPHRYVDWLMFEAHSRGAPRDSGGGYPLLRAEIYTAPAAPVESPVHERLAGEDPSKDAERLGDSGNLFNEREFYGWAIEDNLVKAHQERFRDAQESTVVINKEQMTERLTGVIDKAFEEVFSGEARATYAYRMQEMALWYALAGRESAARLCYAVHRALADPQAPLETVTFLKALVFRAFIHLLPRVTGPEGPEEKSGSEEGSDPSQLIVRPG